MFCSNYPPQAFNAWFSVAPLMPVIKKSLALTKDQVNYANLASVSSTVLARILIGPVCDRYGPKTTMAILLAVGAIPVFCVGLINSATGLVAVRAAMGILGSSFVMSQESPSLFCMLSCRVVYCVLGCSGGS